MRGFEQKGFFHSGAPFISTPVRLADNSLFMMHARPIQITIALLLAFGSPTLANIVDGSTIQSSDKGKDVMDKAEQGNLRSPSNQLTMESKQRNLLDQITAESHQENTANFFDVQRRKLFSWATVVKCKSQTNSRN